MRLLRGRTSITRSEVSGVNPVALVFRVRCLFWCRRAGCLFFLDAIQGLGVFPIDVRDCGVDFLAADGHKWLLGPEGAGLFFVRQEHLSLLRPLMVGWNSVVQGSDYARIELNISNEAARYEGGSQNMVGFIGLGASRIAW